MAVQNGHAKVVELLLGEEDTQASRARKNGCTPLEMALLMRRDRIAALLKARVRVALNEGAACIACLDRRPGVALVPCGHQGGNSIGFFWPKK